MADGAVGNIAQMDAAYFVGRVELLHFFNDLLALNLAKIEQTASGAVACQLTEYIFPGSVPMSRVNWEAKSDYEFVNNYKLLQAAFNKHGIKRYVDVNKLIRAKYQDNLEFCQWLKAFYDQSGAHREDYDPMAVRAKGKGGKKYNELLNKTASKYGSKAMPTSRRSPSKTMPRPTAPAVRSTAARPAPSSAASKKTPTAPSSAATRTAAGRPGPSRKPLQPTAGKGNTAAPKPKASTEGAVADAKLMKENKELKDKVVELETSVLELEKERDFYFKKLRDVEFMLQVRQDKGWDHFDLEGVVGDVFKLLYAPAEEEVQVTEDGEIVSDSFVDASAELTAEAGETSLLDVEEY